MSKEILRSACWKQYTVQAQQSEPVTVEREQSILLYGLLAHRFGKERVKEVLCQGTAKFGHNCNTFDATGLRGHFDRLRKQQQPLESAVNGQSTSVVTRREQARVTFACVMAFAIPCGKYPTLWRTDEHIVCLHELRRSSNMIWDWLKGTESQWGGQKWDKGRYENGKIS